MVKNSITLKANADLQDNKLREWVEILARKIDKMNERTKGHTSEITKIEKRLKQLENKDEK